MAVLILIGLFLFTAMYVSIAAAVIYHLNAYVLPGWNAGRVSIWVFTVLALSLFGCAAYFFFQVPWNNFFAT